MTIKSFLSLRVISPILIVLAFLLGRFTASWPGGEVQKPGEPGPEHPARISIPAGQHVVGFLDMMNGKPVVLASRDSDVQLSGWAACIDADSPLTKVEVLVDDKVKAEAAPSSSYPRPDVAAAYGRPDFEKSGWRTSFSTHGMEAGDHELKALVKCSKGESGMLPVFSLNITNE
jgi:hypothetical protein